MQEIFKDVIGWEGYYEVSNLGRIFSKERVLQYIPHKHIGKVVDKKVNRKERAQKVNKHTGYKMINLNKDGFMKNETVHSMVAKAFIGEIKKGYTVNHKDGNKINNNLENLEIITNAENIRHAFKNDIIKTNHRIMYNGVEYESKTKMRIELNISERIQRKLLESGDAILITNKPRIQTYNQITKIEYENKIYESKKEFYKKTGLSQHKLDKLLLEGKAIKKN